LKNPHGQFLHVDVADRGVLTSLRVAMTGFIHVVFSINVVFTLRTSTPVIFTLAHVNRERILPALPERKREKNSVQQILDPQSRQHTGEIRGAQSTDGIPPRCRIPAAKAPPLITVLQKQDYLRTFRDPNIRSLCLKNEAVRSNSLHPIQEHLPIVTSSSPPFPAL
jgi:hypothetical protein